MKQGTISTRKIRAWAYISPRIKELLNLRSRDEHDSESEIITKALTMYLTKDVTDENLLIAKMSELERTVINLDRKTEVGQKLLLEYFQYYFMSVPEYPADKAALDRLQSRAAERTTELLTLFRKREKHMPRFLESLLGSLLEEEQDIHG
jgi:hypothetical protein